MTGSGDLNEKHTWTGDSFESGAYIRHSFFDIEKKIQNNHFDIFIKNDPDNTYGRLREEHVQYLFSPDEIGAIVPKELFTIEAIWNECLPVPVKPTSERIHFLLRRI